MNVLIGRVVIMALSASFWLPGITTDEGGGLVLLLNSQQLFIFVAI